MTFIQNIWQVILELAPWLFLGAGVAGILHVFVPSNFISKHLGANNRSSVIKAVLFGVPMPLCSCGVIPAAIGLKKDGASDGASTGFLISTPQTGVDSILVSGSFLGWPFAIFKVFAAFTTGIIGGFLVNRKDSLSEERIAAKTGASAPLKKRPSSKLRTFIDFTFDELLYGIWKWLAIGVVISALITTFIPADTLANSAWTQGISGKILMLIFSLALYVCATGSVPIAASLVFAGMPVGTALVFLMAGPASNMATIGAVLKTFGKRVLIIYLATISIGAILFGELFDLFFKLDTSILIHHHHDPAWWETLSGYGFLALLGYYFYSDFKDKLIALLPKKIMPTEIQNFQVSGMSCQVCAGKVKKAIMADEHVEDVDIDLDGGAVTVTGEKLDMTAIKKAVESKGYGVVLGSNS